jgi:hypothetical protein
MSAQGGTLARRGAVHLPIWPVAAVLAAVIAAAVGMSILSGTEGGVVTTVTDTERFANSSAAVREQGATLPFEPPFVNPGMWTQTQAEASVDALEGQVTYAHGLENPGAYLGEAVAPAAIAPPAEPHQPIMVNGEPCHQCI